ncbi:hypothetical protein LTR62_002493 [Meristemomyces frigidus]|uniref:Uncharacterized protein n=1 Tax=Meristemomyces frigidus TaxID=1508187 RepID=A0AAN7YLZ8_9PEZI|nr:hypothetical protein LTR62_002493 [Meristemomyces frigidus]
MSVQVTDRQDGGLSNLTFLFRQLDAYPWEQDEEFQGGLRAILGSVQDPEQVNRITTRAKCYYYARKAGTSVDFEGYWHWRQSAQQPHNHANGSSATNGRDITTLKEGYSGGSGMSDAPKPPSFADICALIADGKPIPGIKDIPDTILDGQASDSLAQRRIKPWERNATSATVDAGEQRASWMK